MAIPDRYGTDLGLGLMPDIEAWFGAGPGTILDLSAVRRNTVFPPERDLRVVDGFVNLVQSLIVRLQTLRGELAPLGHPEYGSRHHELIGEPNVERTRALLKLHVIECIKQEPRVRRIVSLVVTPGEGKEQRQTVWIRAAVEAAGSEELVSLVVPFSFASPLS
jgi:phage baseplate assembly protein W